MAKPQITPQTAASELLARRKARRSLIGFAEYMHPAYEAAEHHAIIGDRLEKVESGELDRLLILMPPRHGKSELASRMFPAWFLGRNPRSEIIAASYNSELASEFGHNVRDIVRDIRYQQLFGSEAVLRQDRKAAGNWLTQAGGSYVAAGVGGTVTGRGADIFLIDDPIKDREAADSETFRRRLWEWYSAVAYTRLSPGGRIVCIQTRWHWDDLAGRLIEEMRQGSGDRFEVLCLRAIEEVDGEPQALWPTRYPLADLERKRAAMLTRDWSALYQQEPTPEEGTFFKREWFRWYSERPQHLRIYGASDYAVTDSGGDYTVHVVAGLDPDGNLYILDIWRAQATADVWIDHFCRLVKQWKPLDWAEEHGQILKSIGPWLERRMRETRAYCAREQFLSVKDKPTRCRSFQALAAMGKVYLPVEAPWLADLLSELLTFPAGAHDDQVDALGLMGRMIDEMVNAHVPEKSVPNNRGDYGRVGATDTVDPSRVI